MVDHDDELRTAELVRRLVLDEDSRDLGPPSKRDESHAGGLRVDFTFDSPVEGAPVALEVTGLYEQQLMRSSAGLNPLKDELDQIAARENLGGWAVMFDAYASFRKLKPIIIELMRRGEEVEVEGYSSADLIASADPMVLRREHRAWASLGLKLVKRTDTDEVQLASVAGGRGIDGFTDLLEAEVAANVDKLAQARERSYESHFAVNVHRFDCSTFPHRTDPPALPEAVDTLWVVFRWAGPHDVPPIWRLQPGSEGWEIVNHPIEID